MNELELIANTFCTYSNIAFRSIIDDLNASGIRPLRGGQTGILFVEGDVTMSPPARPPGYTDVFVVSLTTEYRHSVRVQAFSDLVVSRRMSYGELKYQIARLVRTGGQRRQRGQKVRPDEAERHCPREDVVLGYLLQGYTLQQTAVKTGLTYQAASRYKMKAVVRSGLRSFNELVMCRLKEKAGQEALSRLVM